MTEIREMDGLDMQIESITIEFNDNPLLEPLPHAKEDTPMDDGVDLELEHDENELAGLNLENIVEACRKRDYSTMSIE